MKLFGMNFGGGGRKAPPRKNVGPTKGSRLDAVLAPAGETPGSAMSYRAVFEMVGNEVLKDLRLNKGQATIEVMRARTVNDAPKYQIVIVANVKALISLPVMVEFNRCFTRQLRIISKPAEVALLGVSWAPSRKLAAEDDFQSTDIDVRSPYPGQPPGRSLKATDFGELT